LETYDANADRVYAVGTSNGGHMCQRLADEIPERLAAIGVIVSARAKNNKCVDSDMPLSVLFMNGTDDTFIPYEGGDVISGRGVVLSTDETVDYWINRNQTNTTPTVDELPNVDQRDKSSVEKYRYSNGKDGTEVVLYKVVGGGHTEPSIAEKISAIYAAIVGVQNNDIEMADEVWAFFKDKSRS